MGCDNGSDASRERKASSVFAPYYASQSNIATAVNMLTANDKTLTIWAQLADALDQVLIDRHEVWMT
jgi:hypothetical protein